MRKCRGRHKLKYWKPLGYYQEAHWKRAIRLFLAPPTHLIVKNLRRKFRFPTAGADVFTCSSPGKHIDPYLPNYYTKSFNSPQSSKVTKTNKPWLEFAKFLYGILSWANLVPFPVLALIFALLSSRLLYFFLGSIILSRRTLDVSDYWMEQEDYDKVKRGTVKI